jgi:alpha-glucosidase/alpha-D-xyloside xylohydrolase
LRVTVRDAGGRVIQTLRFEADGPLTFDVGDGPVLGMGEGGPRPAQGRPWREQPVQFDRRGALDTMEPRWQADMYGSRKSRGGAVRHVGLGTIRSHTLDAGRSH